MAAVTPDGVGSWLLAAIGWLLENLVVLIIAGVLLVTLAVFFRLRRSVLFNAWANQSGDEDTAVGRGLADLLLFTVRDIHGVHNRAPEAGFWNKYRDVPAFRYEIDSDVALLASTDLGAENKLASAIVTVLFNLVPLVFQPASVRGSIQRFDDKIHLMVALEGFRQGGRKGKRVSRVWSAEATSITTAERQRPIESLAYSLYLEMAGATLFKSSTSFKEYTDGLRFHLAFLDFGRHKDRRDAEAAYRRSIREDSGAAPPKYNLATLLYFAYTDAANDAAIEQLIKVVSVNDPQLQASARSALANCYLQKFSRFGPSDNPELLDKAITYARQALRDAKHLDAVHKALGFAYHQRSEYDAKQLVAEPRRPFDRSWYRDVMRLRRVRRRAIRHYKTAIRRNNRNYVAHNNLGNLYLTWAERFTRPGPLSQLLRTRRLRTSERRFEQSIRLSPTYHHAHDNLGNARLDMKDFEGAERSFLEALEHKPGYPEGANDLSRLHLIRHFDRDTADPYPRDRTPAGERRVRDPRVGADGAGPVSDLDAAARCHLSAITTPDIGTDQRTKLCRQLTELEGVDPTVCPFAAQPAFAAAVGPTCPLPLPPDDR